MLKKSDIANEALQQTEEGKESVDKGNLQENREEQKDAKMKMEVCIKQQQK